MLTRSNFYIIPTHFLDLCSLTELHPHHSSIHPSLQRMAQLRKMQPAGGRPGAKQPNQLVKMNERTKCDQCSAFIRETDQQVIKYKTHSYHLKCFRCAKCRKSMRDLKVYSGDEEARTLYCEPCYLATLDRCFACRKPIQDEMVSLGPKTKLHRGCFTCAQCKQPLDAYIEQQDQRFCQDCYMATCLPTCATCSKALRVSPDGQSLEQLFYDDKYFHPECFLCDL